jgi:pyrroloquinoline quinone biosynthesis protein A
MVSGFSANCDDSSDITQLQPKGVMNMWIKPEVTEMRFGFEVTMYVCNR